MTKNTQKYPKMTIFSIKIGQKSPKNTPKMTPKNRPKTTVQNTENDLAEQKHAPGLYMHTCVTWFYLFYELFFTQFQSYKTPHQNHASFWTMLKTPKNTPKTPQNSWKTPTFREFSQNTPKTRKIPIYFGPSENCEKQAKSQSILEHFWPSKTTQKLQNP